MTCLRLHLLQIFSSDFSLWNYLRQYLCWLPLSKMIWVFSFYYCTCVYIYNGCLPVLFYLYALCLFSHSNLFRYHVSHYASFYPLYVGHQNSAFLEKLIHCFNLFFFLLLLQFNIFDQNIFYLVLLLFIKNLLVATRCWKIDV